WLSSITRFPYTTLFRSVSGCAGEEGFVVGGGDEGVDFLVVDEAAGEGVEDNADRLGAEHEDGVAHGLVGEDAGAVGAEAGGAVRSEEHTSELQSRENLV